MKIFVLTSFIFLSLLSFGQKNKIFNEKDIVKQEREHYTKSFSLEKSDVGNMYDLVYHRLNWVVDPSQYYISGNVTSYFLAKENNLIELTFDLDTSLVVDSIINNSGILFFSHDENVITITLNTGLAINQLDSLTIYYQGIPSEGIGFGSFIQDYHNDIPIIWTLSEPYGAKEWWPCKQNLVDKIDSIDIYVTTPLPNRVASNGVLVSEITEGENNIVHWKHRHPIPAYLIAISVTNYVDYSEYVHTQDGDSIEVLNYVYPEQVSYIQDQTAELIPVLEFFNDKFMLYPYADEKYGHAQFGWGGGMEHQTMSFVGGFNISLLTHELAHQWFGDYITCGSWEDIWINEGFATYLTGLMYEEFYPDIWEDYKVSQIEYITSEPDGSVLCTDTTSVWRIFNGRLSYTKGGMVLHMLRHELGDSNFFNGIKSYLHDPELANGYAKTPDLQRHLEETADTTLQEFFDDWYSGEGHPSYTIYWWQEDNGTIRLAINQSQSHESVDFFEMHLPIFLQGGDKDTLIRLHHSENAQEYILELDFDVEHLTLDPGFNIIKGQTLVLNSTLLDLNESFIIYPNPADEELYISSRKFNYISQVNIYDLTGKKMDSIIYNTATKNAYVNTSTIESGIYILKISSGNSYITHKIIIK